MGLNLARIGAVVDHPASRVATGLVGAAALTGGVVLAAQYGYGEDFSEGSGIPDLISWQAGAPAAAGIIAGVTGAALSFPNSYGETWAGGPMLAGAGLGVAAGLFLVAPLAREVIAE